MRCLGWVRSSTGLEDEREKGRLACCLEDWNPDSAGITKKGAMDGSREDGRHDEAHDQVYTHQRSAHLVRFGLLDITFGLGVLVMLQARRLRHELRLGNILMGRG